MTHHTFGADHDHEWVVVLADGRVHGVRVRRVLDPAVISVAGVVVEGVAWGGRTASQSSHTADGAARTDCTTPGANSLGEAYRRAIPTETLLYSPPKWGQGDIPEASCLDK